MDSDTIWKALTGYSKNPRKSTIIAICEGLELSIDEVYISHQSSNKGLLLKQMYLKIKSIESNLNLLV